MEKKKKKKLWKALHKTNMKAGVECIHLDSI